MLARKKGTSTSSSWIHASIWFSSMNQSSRTACVIKYFQHLTLLQSKYNLWQNYFTHILKHKHFSWCKILPTFSLSCSSPSSSTPYKSSSHLHQQHISDHLVASTSFWSNNNHCIIQTCCQWNWVWSQWHCCLFNYDLIYIYWIGGVQQLHMFTCGC